MVFREFLFNYPLQWFCVKNPLMVFFGIFPTGTYAVIGTNWVEFENGMTSAQKNTYRPRTAGKVNKTFPEPWKDHNNGKIVSIPDCADTAISCGCYIMMLI